MILVLSYCEQTQNKKGKRSEIQPVDEAIHISIFPISYFRKTRITIGRDDKNIRC